MDSRMGWGLSEHSGGLVFRHAKPSHAHLDDRTPVCAAGLLIYMLGALAKPFRGEISVSPEPFEIMYVRRMQAEK